ncbi:hypothetical protein PMAYCL1PPCAC_09909, partial [Pristionchus mayeri]
QSDTTFVDELKHIFGQSEMMLPSQVSSHMKMTKRASNYEDANAVEDIAQTPNSTDKFAERENKKQRKANKIVEKFRTTGNVRDQTGRDAADRSIIEKWQTIRGNENGFLCVDDLESILAKLEKRLGENEHILTEDDRKRARVVAKNSLRLTRKKLRS